MLVEVDFNINTHVPLYCDGNFIYTSYKKGEFWCLGLYSVSNGKFVINDCTKFFRQYNIQAVSVYNDLLCAVGQREDKNYIIIYDLTSFVLKIMNIDKYQDFFIKSDYCIYINNSVSVSFLREDCYRNSCSVIVFDLDSDTVNEYHIPFLAKYYRNLSFGVIHLYCNDMQDGVSDKIWTSYREPQLLLPEKVIISDHRNIENITELFSSENDYSVEIIAIDETNLFYSIIDIKSSIKCFSKSSSIGFLNDYCGKLFKYNFKTRIVSEMPYDINSVFPSVDRKRAYFYEASNIITDISNGDKICMTKDITNINNSFVLLSDFKYYDIESGKAVSAFKPFVIIGNYMIIQSCDK